MWAMLRHQRGRGVVSDTLAVSLQANECPNPCPLLYLATDPAAREHLSLARLIERCKTRTPFPPLRIDQYPHLGSPGNRAAEFARCGVLPLGRSDRPDPEERRGSYSRPRPPSLRLGTPARRCGRCSSAARGKGRGLGSNASGLAQWLQMRPLFVSRQSHGRVAEGCYLGLARGASTSRGLAPRGVRVKGRAPRVNGNPRASVRRGAAAEVADAVALAVDVPRAPRAARLRGTERRRRPGLAPRFDLALAVEHRLPFFLGVTASGEPDGERRAEERGGHEPRGGRERSVCDVHGPSFILEREGCARSRHLERVEGGSAMAESVPPPRPPGSPRNPRARRLARCSPCAAP